MRFIQLDPLLLSNFFKPWYVWPICVPISNFNQGWNWNKKLKINWNRKRRNEASWIGEWEKGARGRKEILLSVSPRSSETKNFGLCFLLCFLDQRINSLYTTASDLKQQNHYYFHLNFKIFYIPCLQWAKFSSIGYLPYNSFGGMSFELIISGLICSCLSL